MQLWRIDIARRITVTKPNSLRRVGFERNIFLDAHRRPSRRSDRKSLTWDSLFTTDIITKHLAIATTALETRFRIEDSVVLKELK